MVRINFDGSGDTVSKPRSVLRNSGLSIFFVFFLAMGSLFEVFIVREFARAMGQRAWKPAPCTILASEVHEIGGESPYVFAVSYRYEYRGQRYTGAAYKRGYPSLDKYSSAQDLVQRYPVGLTTTCYVNPANASEAVLKRDSLLIGLVALFPLIFVAVGVGGIYFLWRKPPPARAKPIAPIARSARRPGKYVLFAVFAIAGGAMLYPLGIKPIARTIDAENWTPTPCKVLRAEVRSHDSDDGTTYSVYILYEYEFNGRTYKADRYEFVGGSSSGYKGKARVVEQYRTAANPVCYVNPKNPSEAVLKRGFHAKLLVALLPLTFLLVGVGGIVGTLRGRKSNALEPLTPGARVREPDPLSLLRPAEARPSALKPKSSARSKFVGMVLAAIFWNGIVCVFLANAAGLMLLFLLPFVAVGIGLIGLVVYQFLALFNPRPTLELSSGAIGLGGAAELRWSFTGQISRIRELMVTLRGVERATYRRGTNTYTDENTFYELELCRTSDVAEMASGQVGFVLPHDTMHSFNADNNKIIWSIDLRGDIERWPDVKESFEFEVTPAACGR